MKAAVVSALVTLAIVFASLVAIEMMRKRGTDPVGRLADTIAPLRHATPPAVTA